MPNYRIAVMIDPTGAVSGVDVVESKLGRMESRAEAVKMAVQRAFDFNTGPAVAATSSVDRALDEVASSATAAGAAVDVAMIKAGAAAARNNGRIVQSQAQVRASTLQLGQQFNDFSTQVLAGGSVVTAFAQQSGQAAFALQGMNGTLGTVGRFLAGPWGTIMIIATTVLASFGQRLLETTGGLDDHVDKLREDAREAELNRQAQQVLANTLDGVTEALRRNREALEQLENQHESAARKALERVIEQRLRLQGIRTETSALIDQARALLEIQRARASGPTQAAELAALNIADRQATLDRLEANLQGVDAAIVEAERQLQDALSQRVVELSDEAPVERIRRRYDGLIEQARQRAIAEGTVSTELGRQVRLLREQREAEIRAEQDRQRRTSDGVARFRSREQAIGIAGRELLSSGLRVSENVQFGGVRSQHPGMGNVAHGRYALDVNAIAGAEANVPDLRARFDELARRYQARGFRVLWNGQVYEASGNGPSGPIRGSDQHRDHLHLEAPQTIVGRPTQAAGEQQAIAEYRRLAREAETQADAIQGIIDQAASRGRGSRRETVEAQIDRAAADFQRRFNRALTEPERGRVAQALTDAEARETAARFDEAYVQPLERLRALQGVVGQAREILNRQLEESARLGRELTPVEALMIENSVKHGDALELQARILEQVRGPIQEYARQIEALAALLSSGEINQTTFNARVADLGSTARDALRDLQGVDPLTGQRYEDVAARAEENARFARELELYQTHRQQLLDLGISYDALEQAARQRHAQRLNEIDDARRLMVISSAQQISESLLSIAESAFGEQSRVYRAMFIVSKAFAIADALIKIQQGIANALSLPFPANLAAAAAVAAQAASIVANIQAITLQFRDGGLVRGPGTGRSDSVIARVSDGEFIVNAEATRRNYWLLKAINDNSDPSPRGLSVYNNRPPAGASAPGPAPANDNGSRPGTSPPSVEVPIKVVNVLDRSTMLAALRSEEGTRLILNVIEDNPQTVRGMIGGA